MIVLILLAVLIVWIVICNWLAILTNNILINKVYDEHYWLGFFFGALAWLYCIALPDLKVQNTLKEIAEKNKEE